MILQEDLLGALNNDFVEFRYKKNTSFTGQGYVINVLKRFKESFVVEVVEKCGKYIKVLFDDDQIRGLREIFGSFNQTNVGDKILVELITFPPKMIRGRLRKILGCSQQGCTDYLSLIYDLKLNFDFEGNKKIAEEIKYLENARDRVVLKRYSKYIDWTDKFFFTIDGESSKDFDDAICIEKTEDGDFILYIAIADVWSYVESCENILKEAIMRGTSIYLLNRVIPMLPPILSEDLCSLKEDCVRYVIGLAIKFDSLGKMREDSLIISPAIIKSQKRFSYSELNNYLTMNIKPNNCSSILLNSIYLLDNLVSLIRENKKNSFRDSLNIHQLNYEYECNLNEEITGIVEEYGEALRAHKMVEECMILANTLIANWFVKEKIGTIFRIHKSPNAIRWDSFISELRDLGILEDVDIYGKFVDIHKINSLIECAEKLECFKLFQLLLLKALPKAEYSTYNWGHFGLNLKNYLHFTSPIRRLPDLLVHRLLWMYLFKKEDYSEKEKVLFSSSLKLLARTSSLKEKIGIEAERRFINRKLYRYISNNNLKKIFSGVVISRNQWAYIVRIQDMYDGFVRCTENEEIRLGEKVLLEKLSYSWDEFVRLR